MGKGWWLAMSLCVPRLAGAEATSPAQQVSDRAAKSVGTMLDGLREALFEVDRLRQIPHLPAQACLEPVEGIRARVRDAQQAHLDLQSALAVANSAQITFALTRVEQGRQRVAELHDRLHACVERVLREAPVEPWSQQQVSMVAPVTTVEVVWSPVWPPAPPSNVPKIIAAQ